MHRLNEFLDDTYTPHIRKKIPLAQIYDDFRMWTEHKYGTMSKNTINKIMLNKELRILEKYACIRYNNGEHLQEITYKLPKPVISFSGFR